MGALQKPGGYRRIIWHIIIIHRSRMARTRNHSLLQMAISLIQATRTSTLQTTPTPSRPQTLTPLNPPSTPASAPPTSPSPTCVPRCNPHPTHPTHPWDGGGSAGIGAISSMLWGIGDSGGLSGSIIMLMGRLDPGGRIWGGVRFVRVMGFVGLWIV